MTDAPTAATSKAATTAADAPSRGTGAGIVGAGIVAHVPTMVMSEADRKELNEGHDGTLVSGIEALRREVLDPLGRDPGIDTVILGAR